MLTKVQPGSHDYRQLVRGSAVNPLAIPVPEHGDVKPVRPQFTLHGIRWYQNFSAGVSRAGSSRISSSFLAQNTRPRFAPLTSLRMPCFSNCAMARIAVL